MIRAISLERGNVDFFVIVLISIVVLTWKVKNELHMVIYHFVFHLGLYLIFLELQIYFAPKVFDEMIVY
jgi:hypothetical protein